MGNHRNSTTIKHTVVISALLTVVIISILLAFAAMAPNSHRRGPPLENAVVTGPNVPKDSRFFIPPSEIHTAFASQPLFPYSVIPGGIKSPRELSSAMLHDQIVAGHYAGFRAADARIVVLHRDVQAYVSYRMGGEIFWTKRPVTLRKNETVITDGNIEVRARCGNRVSATPQLPVSRMEPAPKTLDTRIPEIGELPVDRGANFPSLLNLDPIENGTNSFRSTEGGTPVLPPIWWDPAPSPIPDKPVPPIGVPEPSTGSLLLLAISAVWLYGKIHEHQ